MSKNKSNPATSIEHLEQEDLYAPTDFEENDGWNGQSTDESLGNEYNPYDQEGLSFDKDARWELEEDETIKEVMRNISNKVNKKGQRDIYAWFRVSFMKSNALSNLDETIINMYVMETANTFNREALMKMRAWNLKSADFPTLSIWIRETIHIFLRRSYKDGERKHRTSRYGGINDQTEFGEQTKSGFSLGNILPQRKQENKQVSQERYDDSEYM